MGGFRARRRGGVTARFAASQASIIRALVSQVEELIAAGEDGSAPGPGGSTPGPLDDLAALLSHPGPAAPPDDPVLARLLPDAYRDDTEAAGEFRRFTEHELRSGKLAAAQTVLDTLPEDGGRVELTQEDAQVWLRALNDVRLALGVRLAYQWIYDWLTYLQETLVRALW
jgi:hypothetical protein